MAGAVEVRPSQGLLFVYCSSGHCEAFRGAVRERIGGMHVSDDLFESFSLSYLAELPTERWALLAGWPDARPVLS